MSLSLLRLMTRAFAVKDARAPKRTATRWSRTTYPLRTLHTCGVALPLKFHREPSHYRSVRFRLVFDDVRIRAGAASVVSPQPVVIERIRTQAGNITASRVADIQVLIARHVTSKRIVQRYIQPVPDRTAYTCPV